MVRLHKVAARSGDEVVRLSIDGLDARLIALLAEEPRIGVLEASRRLRVARGTVQARLDRLTQRGVVRGYGPEVSRGYSREGDPLVHAEESALSKVDSIPDGSTIYSSLEPCSVRKSRNVPCTELIRASGIRRVVYAWREPALFVDGQGVEDLRASGVDVVEVPELAPDVRSVNAHLLR